MTTRDHLVYRLQTLYSLYRDFLPQLQGMVHECEAEQLCAALRTDHDELRNGLETLERALNLLGAQYSQAPSALAAAVKEETGRLKHQQNPSHEQLDIAAALRTIAVGEYFYGDYTGDILLARAIGESDVAILLGENQHQLDERLAALRTIAAALIADVSRSEARRAA